MAKEFTSYHIEERSFVSYIKREIHLAVARGKFSEQRVGEIDIIVSELCSNLIKHAGSGEILYRTTDVDESNSVFEIVCLDKGPGMADTAKMMKDGISTTGTLGHGLGAIERLSSFAQIYSVPGNGTIVYAMVSTQPKQFTKKNSIEVDVRGLCVSKPRETMCGDGYRIKESKNETAIFFGDGLGHGEQAKAAIDTAGNFFMSTEHTDPVEILRVMHEKSRRTRGLVACVAVLDKVNSQWKFCGIGNIMARLYTGIQYRNYMSYNGTIGLNIPKSMKESSFPIERNQHLIMCSDGIKSRWDVNSYHSIFRYDHTILAAALYRDFTRANDDTSVLVAKVNQL